MLHLYWLFKQPLACRYPPCVQLIYMFTCAGEMRSSDSANRWFLLPSILSTLPEGRGGCRSTRLLGAERAGGSVGGRACRRAGGRSGLEPQIILEIASCSVCNQDQTGSGWGRWKSLSIFVKPACACASPDWAGWHPLGRWWKCPTTSFSP